MTNDRAPLDLRTLLLLAFFALIALAPGISSLPPTDRDESRYAVATTQMLDSGDYVDIRFMERPRYLQPAGVYWLQAATAGLLTEPQARAIWAYRIPSLLAAVLAVVLTGWIGARLFGRTVGIGAALLFAASIALAAEARIAKTDAVLLAAITAAQVALLRIYLAPARRLAPALLFWGAVGVGMMIKGPLILLFCGGTILALVLWDRRAAWLASLRPLWGIALLVAIVAPWHVAIGIISEGEFYAHAIGGNLLRKVGEGQQNHGGPPGFYLGIFSLAFWPGSLFAALGLPWVWRARNEPAVRFLVAWIVPAWLVFELIATKLPHYVLPTYPAIACLAAAALFAPPRAEAAWLRGLGIVYAVLWVAVSAVATGLAPIALYHLDGEVSPLAIGLGVVGFTLALAALVATARRRGVAAIGLAGAAGVLTCANVFAVGLPSLASFQLSPRIAAAVAEAAPCPRTTLIGSAYREPSLVFLHGPDRTLYPDSPALAAEAFADAGACAIAVIDATEREAFLARAAELGVALAAVGAVEGLNYSKGDEMALTLYAPAAAIPAP